MRVSWVVEIGDEFAPEFDALHEDVQRKADDRLDAHLGRLRKEGR